MKPCHFVAIASALFRVFTFFTFTFPQAAQSPAGSNCTACPAGAACGGMLVGTIPCFSVSGGDDAACLSTPSPIEACVVTASAEANAKCANVRYMVCITSKKDLDDLGTSMSGCAVDGQVSLPPHTHFHYLVFNMYH